MSSDWRDVSNRLRVIRKALGHTQTGMCALLGVPLNRWNNVENGVPCSRDLAMLICQRVPGMTMDYIFFGKKDGLTGRLIRDLEAAEKSTTPPPRRSSAAG